MTNQVSYINLILNHNLPDMNGASSATHAYFLTNPDEITEPELINLTLHSNLSAILDCRTFPTFKWPQYNHNRLFDFMETNNILYFSLSEHLIESPNYSRFRHTAYKFISKQSNVCILGTLEDELTRMTMLALNKRGYTRMLPQVSNF